MNLAQQKEIRARLSERARTFVETEVHAEGFWREVAVALGRDPDGFAEQDLSEAERQKVRVEIKLLMTRLARYAAWARLGSGK